jgi:hypothetical protein
MSEPLKRKHSHLTTGDAPFQNCLSDSKLLDGISIDNDVHDAQKQNKRIKYDHSLPSSSSTSTCSTSLLSIEQTRQHSAQLVFHLDPLIESVLIPLLPLADLHSLLLVKSFKKMGKKDLLLRELTRRVQTQQCHPDRHQNGTRGHFCFCSLLIRLFSRHSIGMATGVFYQEEYDAVWVNLQPANDSLFEHCMFAKTECRNASNSSMSIDTHGYSRNGICLYGDSFKQSFRTKIATAVCSINYVSQDDQILFRSKKEYSKEKVVDWNSAILNHYVFSCQRSSKAPLNLVDFSDAGNESEYGKSDGDDTDSSFDEHSGDETTITNDEENMQIINPEHKQNSSNSTPNNTSDEKSRHERMMDVLRGDHMQKFLQFWPNGQLDAFRNRSQTNTKYIFPSYEIYRKMANRKFSEKGTRKFKRWQKIRIQLTDSKEENKLHEQKKKDYEFNETEIKQASTIDPNDIKTRYYLTKEGREAVIQHRDETEMIIILLKIRRSDEKDALTYSQILSKFNNEIICMKYKIDREQSKRNFQKSPKEVQDLRRIVQKMKRYLYFRTNLSRFLIVGLRRQWLQTTTIELPQ